MMLPVTTIHTSRHSSAQSCNEDSPTKTQSAKCILKCVSAECEYVCVYFCECVCVCGVGMCLCVSVCV